MEIEVCYDFQSTGTVNLKLKFWGYEKNMGFDLTPKKYNFWLSPDENAMGTYILFCTTLNIIQVTASHALNFKHFPARN